jgi:hypothetical protein
VNPSELEGIECIWRIATSSTDKKVSEKAAELLIKVHTRVSYKNESRINEFEDYYIQKCIDDIKV